MRSALGGLAGLLIGLYIFKISDWVIKYKSNQLSRTPASVISIFKQVKIFLVSLHTLLYIITFNLVSLPEAILIGFFITLSFVITLVDVYMGIIPNESVLIILVAGIVYRMINGGLTSFKGSLLGLGFIVLVFGITGAIVYFTRGTIGVGAGDLKLAMVAAITLGFPGTLYLLLGMAIALLGYLAIKLATRTLVMGSSFPMAGQIMVGFIIALFYPHINI